VDTRTHCEFLTQCDERFRRRLGEAKSAIDCRNRPPTRYQGAAEIVACPDLAWQGVNRCKFVTWISAQRCSSRLKP
jgi:hypothetical protein